MSKPSFLTELFGRRSLSVVLGLMLLLVITASQVAPSQEKEVDRREAIRRIVQTYIQTGEAEYAKGFFDESVKTFQMADRHKEDLTEAVREQLSELLDKSQIASLNRKRALETFRAVNELIKQDQLLEAKTSLEKIKDNKFLTQEERGQISEVFRQIDIQVLSDKAKVEKVKASAKKSDSIVSEVKQPVVGLDEQKKEVMALFYRSVGFYNTGEFEKAREGLVKIASSNLVPPSMKKAVETYLTEINKVLPERAVSGQAKPVAVAVAKPEVAEAEAAE